MKGEIIMSEQKPLTADEKRRIPQIILLYCMRECTKDIGTRAVMLQDFIQKHDGLDNDFAEQAKALIST